jgi:riboflavin synthase
MFTGIVEEVGRVTAVEDLGGGRRLTLEADLAAGLRPDQSVAVNGACQTVVAASGRTFEVVAVEETLRKTNFGALAPGARVNLERAMSPTGRLDGHFVQGHVDATGTVTGIEPEATSRLYTFAFDAAYASYLIPVGSVTVDGVSLTVARLHEETFTVAVIPHTYTHTIVAGYAVGDRVNLEFDLVGKYVVRWLSLRQAGRPMPAPTVG